MKIGIQDRSPQFTKRLVMTFSLFAVATVVYCVFAIARIDNLHDKVSEYHGPVLFVLVDIQSKTNDAIQESFAYIVSGDKVEKEEFEALTRDLSLAASRFQPIARLNDPDESARREKFESIVNLHRSLAVYANEMFDEFERNGKVTRATFNAYEVIVDELTNSMNALVHLEEKNLDAARAASASALGQTEVQLGFLAVITCALSAASTVSLLRSFRHYVVDKLRSRFLQEVLFAQESERSRIARELHDETGSALTSVIIGLRNLGQELVDKETLSRLEQLQGQIEQTLEEVKRLAHGLHPLALEQLGFGAAVEQYLLDYASLHENLDVKVRINDIPENIPLTVSTALYRILQEALMNVVKHANAQQVSIIVDHRADQLVVVVEDDGRGMNPAEREDDARATRLGLHGILERVSALQGELVIEPTPGGGTTLVVEVPLKLANHG